MLARSHGRRSHALATSPRRALAARGRLFIIICPALRGLSELLLLLVPLPRDAARGVHRASRALSYYYAHEVMIVGVPLLGLTIGPLTSTLFTKEGTPACGPIDRAYDQPNCFDIAVLPSAGYPFICASVVVYLLTGFDGSPTHKFLHARLYPEDADCPPTCRRARTAGDGR